MIVNAMILVALTIKYLGERQGITGYLLPLPLQAVIRYTGVWHSWKIFAHSPMHVNHQMHMRIKSGNETLELDWPDFTDMGRLQAFARMRERKYRENLLSGEMTFLCETLAEHMLQWYASAGQHPDEISIVRVATDVP